ncbi:MAG: Nif3-like dinuclear metal center hexameric protein [bacterium]
MLVSLGAITYFDVMKTSDLIQYLDGYLEIDKIPDASWNGLQVQGKDDLQEIGVAVDACQDVIDAAAEIGVDFLVVHHGLFWDKKLERITGAHYRRVKALLEAGINLYAAHLPLDWHPEVGNNAVLARRMGLELVSGFGRSGATDGRSIGWTAQAPQALTQAELIERATAALAGDVRADFFGPKMIQRLAIVTGGGTALLSEVVATGVDAYITGEPKHSFYHFTREHNLNVLYGGHYETETFGVITLAEHLEQKFQLPFQFLDFPTGL